jgi:2-methylcitrate dehydratase PrpD
LDFDDYHPPSDAHVTSVLVPAVLAMGEANNASGKETLAALMLGTEVIGRLGRAYKARRTHRGFLPTSIIGGFGATAAACRLHGCSVDQTVHALGIWYAHCAGNRQSLFDRTLTKRIQPGIAAQAGVFATFLAAADVTGPKRIVGGQGASLTQIYGCRRDAKPPTVGEVMTPYDDWQIEQLHFKRYACCGVCGRAIEAAKSLGAKHKLKPSDIKEIRLFGDDIRSPFGAVAWGDNPMPHVVAQFCVPYAGQLQRRCGRQAAIELARAHSAICRGGAALRAIPPGRTLGLSAQQETDCTNARCLSLAQLEG